MTEPHIIPSRKRGRPLKVARRTAEVHLYLTPEELATIDAARGTEERNVWIRYALLQVAREELASGQH